MPISRFALKRDLPNVNELIKQFAVHPIFTSKGEVNIQSSSFADLRNTLIPANSFKFGEHLRFEGGGFIQAVGGNIITVDFQMIMGGQIFFSLNRAPGTPGPFLWLIHGIIAQNFDHSGMFFYDNLLFPFRGELNSWSGPTTNMNLQLQARISVSAGTGFVVNETWNIIKIPNGE